MNLIELTGCPGSGKTTIAETLAERLRRVDLDVRLLRVGGMGVSDWHAVRQITARGARHRDLYRFLMEVIARDADTWIDRAKLIRNVAKKLGTLDALAGRRAQGIVVWDEGTVHIAQNAFVHGANAPQAREIERFAHEVPLPDVLVYVRAPVELLQHRLERRPHRLLERSTRLGRPFLEHAHQAVEILVSHPRIKDRVVTLENGSDDPASLETAARAAAETIRERLLHQTPEAGV